MLSAKLKELKSLSSFMKTFKILILCFGFLLVNPAYSNDNEVWVKDLYSSSEEVSTTQSKVESDTSQVAPKNEAINQTKNESAPQNKNVENLVKESVSKPNKEPTKPKNINTLSISMTTFYIGAFCVVVIIFILCLWLKKVRNLISGRYKDFEILRVLSVGQKERIVLLKVGKEELVVGVTPQNINLIYKLEKSIKDEDSKAIFDKKLDNAKESNQD